LKERERFCDYRLQKKNTVSFLRSIRNPEECTHPPYGGNHEANAAPHGSLLGLVEKKLRLIRNVGHSRALLINVFFA
jgi:hypothetical protein